MFIALHQPIPRLNTQELRTLVSTHPFMPHPLMGIGEAIAYLYAQILVGLYDTSSVRHATSCPYLRAPAEHAGRQQSEHLPSKGGTAGPQTRGQGRVRREAVEGGIDDDVTLPRQAGGRVPQPTWMTLPLSPF